MTINHLDHSVPGEMAPRYASIQTWCRMVDWSRSTTYLELGKGNLRAVKHGKRVLIDVQHGLAYMASLPAVQIRASNGAA